MLGRRWCLIGLLLFSSLGCEGSAGDATLGDAVPDRGDRLQNGKPATIQGPSTVQTPTARGSTSNGRSNGQAVQLDPQAIRANNRGVGLMGRFEYGAAVEAFAALVAEHPDWLAAKLNLAIATLNRQRQGDEKAALALVDEVLTVDPGHPRAHYVAGLLRLYLSSPRDAMGHFAEVAEADPKDPYAAYYLGQCLAQQSQPEKALAEYQRALALDPYLRSAAYGAFQALQRLRRREEARGFIAQYQRLATNPRARLAEFKYTRMGPKAEALAAGVATGVVAPQKPIPRPPGPVFGDPAPLTDAGFSLTPSRHLSRRTTKHAPVSITVMDLESNGLPDLFVAGLSTAEKVQHNLLLTGTPEGKFTPRNDTPLTRVPEVNGALWGDFDNDGHLDVYLLRQGQNQLWRNDGNGNWVDVTRQSGTGNGTFDTVDGAFFDADHDGDLDLFLVNANGPDALLHNNLDGTFRPGGLDQANSPQDRGAGNRGSFAVIPTDLDRDRDADIIVLNRVPPHRVYINDRLWSYHSSVDFSAFEATPALSAMVGDVDSDGSPEIYTVTPDGVLLRWSRNDREMFVSEPLPYAPETNPASSRHASDSDADSGTSDSDADSGTNPSAGPGDNSDVDSEAGPDTNATTHRVAGRKTSVIPPGSPWARMAISDVDGDGTLELLIGSQAGWSALRVLEHAPKAKETSMGEPMATALFTTLAPPGKRLLGLAPLLQRHHAGHGLAGLVGGTDEGIDEDIHPMHWPAGPGRHEFLALAFSGMEDTGKSMRSNASGIGTRITVRRGAHWTIVENFRDHSGPGQSLQPVPIGLGGASHLDFVAIDWSDGVFQSEIDLEAGRIHRITETQRQLSSCPVLFAWDGQKYRFVTDFLGVGGIGYALGPPGQYGTPRPWENLLLPQGVQPKEGRYAFKLTEPMEESGYLDAVGLAAYDLPPGWKMVLDERMAIQGPQPTGATIFYRRELLPERAVNERGETITSLVVSADGRAAPPGASDRRFIGRLAEEHVVTLEFPKNIDGDQNPTTGTLPPRGDERNIATGRATIDEAAMGADTSAPTNTPILIMDGWVEYPYSQTTFAAWQAGAAWEAPTVEAQGSDGAWHTVLTRFGYPAGMPRTMSVPLRGLPPGTSTLRVRTNQEIYWDRIAVAFPETPPRIHGHRLPLAKARLSTVGFPKRIEGPQRYPDFDYDQRRPFWDTRPMAGFYTEYGPVDELLMEVDDAIAVFGAGEEIHVEFNAPRERPPPGWRRYLVLETHGWTKDRDLYTKDGETVAPLPGSGKPSKRRDTLHARYNTRYVGAAKY
uniref:Tetratricopeptide repeat-containing protein n=1 Tax=Candidatus Kentrum sp. LFY TaxID=2126342 RepID=A0A450V3V5_9GAMM|nr:MAG: Tetratricopeptide repeat-containing protein [Candidatus Kentron sp. LFY]